ncbi:MAG: succinate-semialdehyde dehydrogenase/glutarate-semialdehyde dehydrogenase, partial [Cyclobacteriaceae bacterium]
MFLAVASKRFIAVEAIADKFIQKFKDKLSK